MKVTDAAPAALPGRRTHQGLAQSSRQSYWIPVLLGLLSCFAFTGVGILNPLNAGWQMLSDDSAQHLIGWHFFRHTPLFQFPLGANPGYGEMVSGSIVFSDSIPLLALPFKLIDAVLPASFHYFGWWIALCFVLQGVFAWTLLSSVISDPFGRALATALFILSPPMLARMGGHDSLMAHWTLLAAIHLYLQPQTKPGRWALLLCATALIHAYLLAMTLALYLLDTLSAPLRFSDRSRPRLNRARLMAIGRTFALLALTLWAAGYFSTAAQVESANFSEFRMNLLAPIDPDTLWSRFLPNQPSTAATIEGFNYFGLGLIALAIVAAASYLAARKRLRIHWPVVAPLVIIAIGLTAYALSNRIAWGSQEIIAYPLPHAVHRLTDIFRAAGRFFWVPFYLLQLGFVVVLVSGMTRTWRNGVLAALVALQLGDISHAVPEYRRKFSTPEAIALSSGFWTDVPRQYKRIAIVPPQQELLPYAPLALFAAKHNLRINSAYLGRIDTEKFHAAQAATVQAVNAGQYAQDTLYVFLDDTLWRTALENAGSQDLVTQVDNYRVLAPGWNGCVASCSLQRLGIASPG